jgi:hypothetical protein
MAASGFQRATDHLVPAGGPHPAGRELQQGASPSSSLFYGSGPNVSDGQQDIGLGLRIAKKIMVN